MRPLFCFLMLFASSVQAQHAVHVKNLNLDKNNHAAVGAVLGAFDWRLGCAAGLAKEVSDDVFDRQDFLYTCAGAGFSSWLGNGKSKLFKYDVVVIILDGLSTDNAIRQGGIEIGYPRKIIGHIPSTAKIAAWTAFRLWLLNESEGWSKGWKGGFQWGVAVNTTLVVKANYSVEFK